MKTQTDRLNRLISKNNNLQIITLVLRIIIHSLAPLTACLPAPHAPLPGAKEGASPAGRRSEARRASSIPLLNQCDNEDIFKRPYTGPKRKKKLCGLKTSPQNYRIIFFTPHTFSSMNLSSFVMFFVKKDFSILHSNHKSNELN